MERLKNNLKLNDYKYFCLAFEQAKINLGSTKTNPSVGCVVVKDNTIISSGRTSLNGRPHAEFNSLNKNLNFHNAQLYITLEPCSHYGLTPPCTKIIIKKKIKKVHYALSDIDIRSRNKSKKILNKKNILTKKSNIINNFANDFYQSYLLQHTNELPLIDAKIAISKDYYTKDKKNKWITNIDALKRAHLLRSMYDCIITTSKTVNEDNSVLNCRINGLENRSPDLIIIDRFLKLKRNLKLYKNKKNRKIIIFTTTNNNLMINFLKKKGIKVYFFKSLINKVDFINLFNFIKKLKYSRIFFETGLTFMNFLIKNNFLNHLYLFKTKFLLKTNGYNSGDIKVLKKIKIKNKINVNLNGNTLFKIKLK